MDLCSAAIPHRLHLSRHERIHEKSTVRVPGVLATVGAMVPSTVGPGIPRHDRYRRQATHSIRRHDNKRIQKVDAAMGLFERRLALTCGRWRCHAHLKQTLAATVCIKKSDELIEHLHLAYLECCRPWERSCRRQSALAFGGMPHSATKWRMFHSTERRTESIRRFVSLRSVRQNTHLGLGAHPQPSRKLLLLS